MKTFYHFIILLTSIKTFCSEFEQKPMQQRDLNSLPLASMFYQDIYKKSLVTKEKLETLCFDIASQFPGGEAEVPALKSFERTKDKVDLDYKGNWKKITDIVRGSISFQTEEDLKKGVFLFNQKLPLMSIKDRIWQPTQSGYIDILALFKDPENNIIGEVQFHLCHILRAKQKAHKLYERIQAIERRASIKNRALTDAEKSRIKEIQDEAKDIYQQAVELVKKKVPCSIKSKL